MKTLLVALSITLLAFDCLASEPLESLRLYGTQPANFEYVFTAVMKGSDGKPVLAFTDRGGSTSFAGPGEKVGQYTLAGMEAVTSRVFNATVSAYLETVSYKAFLMPGSPDTNPAGLVQSGGVITLEQGRPCQGSGWKAEVVSMESGGRWEVVETDWMDVAGRMIEVVSISRTSVVVMVEGMKRTIPAALAVERIWLKKVEEIAAAAAKPAKVNTELAEALRPAAEPARAAIPQVVSAPERRRVLEVKNAPRMFFGSEYYYPIEFQYVPEVRNSSGRVVFPARVVPKTFTRVWTGTGVK